MISVDTNFKLKVPSPFGHIGFVHILALKVHYGEIFGIKLKSQLTRIVITFIVHAQRLHYPKRVVVVKADNELNTKE